MVQQWLMVKNMNENKIPIEILDQVFVYQVDPGSNKKLITLHQTCQMKNWNNNYFSKKIHC